MIARPQSPARTVDVISIAALAMAEILAMSLWFMASVLLPEMRAEAPLSVWQAGALATSVQAGFVLGALGLAMLGLADRLDPRRIFAGSALLAAAANAAMVLLAADHSGQIVLRALVGAALAGVYPVGMKIAVGWTTARRGTMVGLLIGALTVGSAASHLIAFGGGHGWRTPTLMASGLAVMAAGLMAAVRLGPHHQRAPGFSFGVLALAWRDRRLRLAYAGYLGHMWELYAFWAWIGSVLALSLAEGHARLTAFAAIALGGLACLPAGGLADRIGKAQVARAAMLISALAGVATAASLGGPAALTILAAMVWGASVIPDSAQFSALVADAAPAARAGSLMTLQTAIGFLFAALSVQLLPLIAAALGWSAALLVLVPGPLLGAVAMTRLIALQRDPAAE
ncbi:MFS transporter [Tabrizicola sp.]|uniref:MFS transporter n=1 Tax=Tabrizicola sp. TaxID=2005166 RepID=UPI002FDEB695